MTKPIRHQELACAVHGLAYDFATHTGTLAMAEHNCCDMAGAITLFERIDQDVKAILTIAGEVDDTAFYRQGDEWVAA